MDVILVAMQLSCAEEENDWKIVSGWWLLVKRNIEIMNNKAKNMKSELKREDEDKERKKETNEWRKRMKDGMKEWKKENQK